MLFRNADQQVPDSAIGAEDTITAKRSRYLHGMLYHPQLMHRRTIGKQQQSAEHEFHPGQTIHTSGSCRSVLQSHDDFEFVDIVDEVSADSVSITGVRLNTGDVVDSDDDDDDMNIKERLLRKIVRKGYVRPRQTV